MKFRGVINTVLVLFATTFGFASISNAAAPLKEWTFLVFLNADNNLYDFSFLNISQMEKVGSSDQVNIVVQVDPEPRNMPTSRYYITRNPNSAQGKISSQVVQSLPETDMGNPKTLADFLVWGVQNYPAKKYAVVVWNHGNGWEGISYDDNPSTHLTMPALRQGLEVMNSVIAQQRGVRTRGPLLDIINFDACLMSTLEVAHELKDVAKFLVGSQFLEPGEGENYTSFLQPLVAKPQMTAKEFAEIMVYQYALNYKNSTEINYAAVDLSKVGAYTTLFNQTAQVLNGSPAKKNIRKAFGSGSFDLVTGLNQAKVASTSDANSSKALDLLIGSYGYPLEGVQRGVVGNRESLDGLSVVQRFSPGEVYYRYGTSGQWLKGDLAKNALGQYQFVFPNGKPRQYFVLSKSVIPTRAGNKEMASQEGLSTYLRDGNNPIVFHNQFPLTSPLVADAYTRATRGAHGMTLYSLAGLIAAGNPSTSAFGKGILNQYKLLSFAITGAPNWTAFFQ